MYPDKQLKPSPHVVWAPNILPGPSLSLLPDASQEALSAAPYARAMRHPALPAVAALLLAASLGACASLGDATEDPPPRGETFPGVSTSPTTAGAPS